MKKLKPIYAPKKHKSRLDRLDLIMVNQKNLMYNLDIMLGTILKEIKQSPKRKQMKRSVKDHPLLCDQFDN